VCSSAAAAGGSARFDFRCLPRVPFNDNDNAPGLDRMTQLGVSQCLSKAKEDVVKNYVIVSKGPKIGENILIPTSKDCPK
jgi:hypothetical protein